MELRQLNQSEQENYARKFGTREHFQTLIFGEKHAKKSPERQQGVGKPLHHISTNYKYVRIRQIYSFFMGFNRKSYLIKIQLVLNSYNSQLHY